MRKLIFSDLKALEKEVQIPMQRNTSNAASELLGLAQTVNGIPLITHNLGDAEADFLRSESIGEGSPDRHAAQRVERRKRIAWSGADRERHSADHPQSRRCGS